MANLLTGARILCSVALLFCHALSPAFTVLYIAAGCTDMLDGAVARKTRSVSDFGSRFDTVADLVFVAVCLTKLIPVLAVPAWIWAWTAAIALVKAASIACGYIRQGRFVAVHNAWNKAAGALLFALPLTWPFLEPVYGAAAACAVASAAALLEWRAIRAEVGGPG